MRIQPLPLLLPLAVLAACAPSPEQPAPIDVPWESPSPAASPSPEPAASAPFPSAPSSTCAGAPSRGAATRGAASTVRSWCLYYGPATEEALERLAGYELVVVDPAALGANAADAIAALKRRGCLVAGYLSMFEIASWHRYRPRIPREWIVLDADGTPWAPWGGKDVGWEGNLAASFAEPGWRAMLADLVQSEVLDYGCDGVFMDTLEDLDFASMPAAERERQFDGARRLMAELDARYPDAFFIANRALQRALDAVGDHIDALCWESFAPKYFADPQTRTWMEQVAAHVAERQAAHPFRVLALWTDEKPGPDNAAQQETMRSIALEHGYLPFCSTGGYHRLPAPAPAAR